MLAFLSGPLLQLIRFHYLFAGCLIVGFAAWASCSRRKPHEPLSWRSRLLLALLLAATPCSWWLTGQRLLDEDIPGKMGGGLGFRTAETIGIAHPQLTSFASPDVRILNNRKVLMLLPPGRMEWVIDTSVRAVSMSFGFDPTAYERGDSDGADIFLELVDPALKRLIFHRQLNPRQIVGDRGVQNEVVVLPPRSRTSKLVLRTEAGPAGNTAWDWVYLSHFYFRKGAVYAHQQFPGFNRVPDELEVEHTGLFPGDDGKPFLFIAAPGMLAFDLRDKDHRVEIDYGFMRSAYADGGNTNGAILRVELQSTHGEKSVLFEYYARPVEREADRHLLHASVSVPHHQSGDRLVVRFLPGDNDNASWDHTFIRRLSLE